MFRHVSDLTISLVADLKSSLYIQYVLSCPMMQRGDPCHVLICKLRSDTLRQSLPVLRSDEGVPDCSDKQHIPTQRPLSTWRLDLHSISIGYHRVRRTANVRLIIDTRWRPNLQKHVARCDGPFNAILTHSLTHSAGTFQSLSVILLSSRVIAKQMCD